LPHVSLNRTDWSKSGNQAGPQGGIRLTHGRVGTKRRGSEIIAQRIADETERDSLEISAADQRLADRLLSGEASIGRREANGDFLAHRNAIVSQ
jgi:hypothetical protein